MHPTLIILLRIKNIKNHSTNIWPFAYTLQNYLIITWVHYICKITGILSGLDGPVTCGTARTVNLPTYLLVMSPSRAGSSHSSSWRIFSLPWLGLSPFSLSSLFKNLGSKIKNQHFLTIFFSGFFHCIFSSFFITIINQFYGKNMFS